MAERERPRADEPAVILRARLYDILWVLVIATMIGWAYFKLTGPAL